jgi:hypothetical protein
MNERELLELAAKAAGIEYGWQHIYDDYEGSTSEKWDWNPITDDGDNRRLQTKLRIGLMPCESGGWVATSHDPETHEELFAVTEVNPNRAVVRAAAAIGEAMQ